MHKFLTLWLSLFLCILTFLDVIVNGIVYQGLLPLAQWVLTSALYQCRFWAQSGSCPSPKRYFASIATTQKSRTFISLQDQQISSFSNSSLVLFFCMTAGPRRLSNFICMTHLKRSSLPPHFLLYSLFHVLPMEASMRKHASTSSTLCWELPMSLNCYARPSLVFENSLIILDILF